VAAQHEMNLVLLVKYDVSDTNVKSFPGIVVGSFSDHSCSKYTSSCCGILKDRRIY